ncbi:hypothetical protein SCP_1600170 [Sparassis crispa]|uniref:Uncharacterized protein n=1 Tax=Sparassis crispa TaxID=139825 RepID=A0A401H4I3_9APHY|nr:hypothetical protein SCP_1600170 [Sparassis crispa]GBE89356.1 hypothetical protein SCP_1600170 [Sparassis crispa]
MVPMVPADQEERVPAPPAPPSDDLSPASSSNGIFVPRHVHEARLWVYEPAGVYLRNTSRSDQACIEYRQMVKTCCHTI